VRTITLPAVGVSVNRRNRNEGVVHRNLLSRNGTLLDLLSGDRNRRAGNRSASAFTESLKLFTVPS
jgi:hypothetical protein